MAVVQATLKHGKRAGYMIGAGAILAELVYVAIPLFGFSYFLEDHGVYKYLYIIFAPILIFLGLYTLLTRKRILKRDTPERLKKRNSNHFLYGAALCWSNPMTLIFWTQITAILKGKALLTAEMALPFLAGIPIGTSILYYGLTRLVHHTGNRISLRTKLYLNILIGLGFLALGVWLLIAFFTALNEGG